MSSAYPWVGEGGHGVGLLANQEDCKMGGAKLTFSPRGGQIWQGKVSWVKCFSLKSPPDIYLKKLGFTWLIHFNFNYTGSLLSQRSLLRTTVNEDHSNTREMNLAIKRQEGMGEFLSRELTIGQCDPAGDAFFSRNKNSSVYINKWYPDYRSKQCACPQIYFLWSNLSCLFLVWFVMRND